MKTRNIPVLIMLIAGSITSIITYWLHYPLKTMLWVLLVVLLVFYFVGCQIKNLLDKFEEENRKQKEEEEAAALAEEGAVIEKESVPEGMAENEGSEVKNESTQN